MTTRQVKLIGKKEFAAAVLDSEHEAFVVHISALRVDIDNEIYFLRKASIAQLKIDEALTKVPSKYTNFVNVFSSKLAVELLKHMKINDYAIKLIDN